MFFSCITSFRGSLPEGWGVYGGRVKQRYNKLIKYSSERNVNIFVFLETFLIVISVTSTLHSVIISSFTMFYGLFRFFQNNFDPVYFCGILFNRTRKVKHIGGWDIGYSKLIQLFRGSSGSGARCPGTWGGQDGRFEWFVNEQVVYLVRVLRWIECQERR